VTKKLCAVILTISLLFSSGCGTLLTKIPFPFEGYEIPALYSYPGVRIDLEGIDEGYYFFILDLPLSFVADTFFITLYLLYPIAWLLRP